jgi:hypothetical protein
MPLGLERRVTAGEGGWVREIDGQPAWSVLKEYLDGEPGALKGIDIIHLCVGEPLDPALRAEYGSDYIIRTPPLAIAGDPARRPAGSERCSP